MKKLAYFAMVIVFGLAACGPQAQSAITLTSVQSVTAPSPTSTILATPTIVLPTLTPTPTQTIKPHETATENAQLELNETKFPDCFGPFHSLREKSPDGQWVAGVCDRTNLEGSGFYDFFPPIDLRIRKQDGSKEWHVSFRDLTGGDFIWYKNRFGEDTPFVSFPFPYHWYKDSRYLFIAPRFVVDGNQSDGLGLYRFDTQTGRYSPFLPVGESSYNFSFSPDDAYYVYSYGMDNKTIHIASLETGEEQTVQVADGQAAGFRRFLWSPDSKKFVFIYDNLTIKKSALLLFDTKQKILTTLLEIEDDLIPIRWESKVEVVLEEYKLQGEEWQEQEYLLNIDTKVLEKIFK